MCPIEIYVDGDSIGTTGSGPSELQLPRPPGGSVSWDGDTMGFGQIITGPHNTLDVFQLSEVGQKAGFIVPLELSASLFPNAENVESKQVDIVRVEDTPKPHTRAKRSGPGGN